MKNFFVIISLFGLFGCDNIQKTSFVTNYENFIEDLKKNGVNYTDAQWNETESKFKNYTEVELPKFKESLSTEERSKVNQLTGKYYAILAKHKAGQLTNEFKDLLDQTKGVLEEVER